MEINPLAKDEGAGEITASRFNVGAERAEEEPEGEGPLLFHSLEHVSGFQREEQTKSGGQTWVPCLGIICRLGLIRKEDHARYSPLFISPRTGIKLEVHKF